MVRKVDQTLPIFPKGVATRDYCSPTEHGITNDVIVVNLLRHHHAVHACVSIVCMCVFLL